MGGVDDKFQSLPEEKKVELWNLYEKLEKTSERKKYRRLDQVTFPTHIAGIYTIINQINGKRYIGKSKCINDRISTHRSQLDQGIHYSIQLQRDYHYFGVEAFDVVIVEQVSDRKQLTQRENYWISAYKITDLYNSMRDHRRATRAHNQKLHDEQYIQGSLFEFEYQ